MFRAKQPLHLRHSDLDETADTGVSEERGRRKTAELHTSGAKRAETRGGEVVRADHRLGSRVGGELKTAVED